MGNLELLLILVVALLVIGPERLPETVRTLGLWFGRLRRSFLSIKTEIEKEVGMDDIRRQLHNEAVMEEMRRIENEVKNSIHDPDPQSSTPADSNETESATSATSTADNDEPAAASAPASPDTPEETTPLPPSEAELEAMHARRARQARAAAGDDT